MQFFNDATYLGNARNSVTLKCSTGMTCTKSGQTFTMTSGAGAGAEVSPNPNAVYLSTNCGSRNGPDMWAYRWREYGPAAR